MYSTRTRNTECTNSQNVSASHHSIRLALFNSVQPYGFHLADGAMYTYMTGDEYEDIFGSWDWNLIPGITTDYGATELSCDNTQWVGVQEFVGGVSAGSSGIAVMRYTNPYTQTLDWKKAWFFLPGDVQHVMVSGLTSTSSAPVYSA